MRISIVIPTFNRANYLEAAINSALAQDYPDLEVLISDNASTDETIRVVEPFLKDPRVKYFRNPENIGMVRNWHKAVFEYSTGEWFLILSDDDILINPSLISQSVDIIQRDSSVTVVYSNSYIYDQDRNTVTSLRLPFQSIERGPFVFSRRGTVLPQDFALCGILFNKKLAQEMNAFSNPNMLSCDTELFLKLCLWGNVGVIKVFSSIYRMHSGNLLKSMNKDPDLLEGNIEAFLGPLEIAIREKIDDRLIRSFVINARLQREILVCLLKVAAVDSGRARKLWATFLTRLQRDNFDVLPSKFLCQLILLTGWMLAPLLVLRRRLIFYSKNIQRFVQGRYDYFAPLKQKVCFIDPHLEKRKVASREEIIQEISSGPALKPLVGIALATYEPDMDFFEQQIDSLRRQTYSRWICVVVDDYSSEEKFKGIQKVLQKDSRFVLYRNEVNCGSFRSFEKAIGYLPACEYISFCDQDDVWKYYKLEFLVNLLREPGVSFVHSDQALIDKNGDVLASSCWDTEGRYVPSIGTGLLLFRNTVSGCAVMFKASVLKTALPFPDIPVQHQPYYHDVWIAMHACLYGQGMAIKEPLVLYRQHENNQVGARFKGRGLHLPSLVGRSVRLYQARLKLRDDFIYSLKLKDQLNENISEAVNFTDSFWSLIYRSFHYSLPNPKFFKTGILLILGFIFSRGRERPS